jgi:hypothetical protein
VFLSSLYVPLFFLAPVRRRQGQQLDKFEKKKILTIRSLTIFVSSVIVWELLFSIDRFPRKGVKERKIHCTRAPKYGINISAT